MLSRETNKIPQELLIPIDVSLDRNYASSQITEH